MATRAQTRLSTKNSYLVHFLNTEEPWLFVLEDVSNAVEAKPRNDRAEGGRGGGANGSKSAQLRRETCLTPLRLQGHSLTISHDFSPPAYQPPCSCLSLFVHFPPITSAPKSPERRGPDPKWTSLVVLTRVQPPTHSPGVRMSQGPSKRYAKETILLKTS